MKSGWEGGGWLVSEQYLSLKTRLTKFVSSLKKREICFFPFLKGRNSKNKTLPLFSKDLKLFSLKKKKMKLEMKFMDVFTEVIGKGGNKQIGFALKIW